MRTAERAARHALEPDLDAGLDAERASFLQAAASADAREGVEAFLAKPRSAAVCGGRADREVVTLVASGIDAR